MEKTQEKSKTSDKTDVHGKPLISGFKTFLGAALDWFRFGLQVIPVLPGTKQTALKWDPWLDDLSEEKITEYWEKHPDHEVGFIVGDNMVVFDADSPEAVKALWGLEKAFGVPPKLTSTTRKGQHHFFKLAPGVFAKSDSYNAEEYPERIDVKTGRGLILLPPSTNKTIKICYAQKAGDLAELEQDFIDALFIHNGRSLPRPQGLRSTDSIEDLPKGTLKQISALLEHLDPDSGYEEWFQVLSAIHHESNGCDEGLELANAWSSRGAKYKGRREIEVKWRSFRIDIENPITIRTLCKRVEAAGRDWMSILSEVEGSFEDIDQDTVVIQSEIKSPETVQQGGTIFDKFSLTGMSEQLEKDALEQVHVLGQFALSGQITVLCAEGGTGKTLVVLNQAIKSIQDGRIDPSKTYYLNMDDNYQGLIDKVKIAEEFGFHMLAEGYQGFSASSFLGLVRDMNRTNQARGVVVFLDTLKKFVKIMNKDKSPDYYSVLREFSSKGGTIIALAHTNKNPNQDGRVVFAGTNDLKDDFDCMYILRLISERGAKEKIILFEKEKGRGPVVEKACYSYTSGQDVTYNEMFLSVQEVDETQVAKLEHAEEMRSEAEVIDAVISCINEGVNTKMKLAEAAAKRSGASKRSVLQLINKYTGNDPTQHRWFFVRGERGKQTFSVLEIAS